MCIDLDDGGKKLHFPELFCCFSTDIQLAGNLLRNPDIGKGRWPHLLFSGQLSKQQEYNDLQLASARG